MTDNFKKARDEAAEAWLTKTTIWRVGEYSFQVAFRDGADWAHAGNMALSNQLNWALNKEQQLKAQLFEQTIRMQKLQEEIARLKAQHAYAMDERDRWREQAEKLKAAMLAECDIAQCVPEGIGKALRAFEAFKEGEK